MQLSPCASHKLQAWLILSFTYVSQISGESCEIQSVSGFPPEDYTIAGDVNIGIIMPVHMYEEDKLCSDEIESLDILQRMESMAFAVREINTKTTLLHNVTLGFTVVDDCQNELAALGRTFHFIQTTDVCSKNRTFYPIDVVAVIGAENNERTVKIADMLALFEIPLLSYFATDPVLNAYPYFFRLVPTDVEQARVIALILSSFQWSFISILYSEGTYGNEIYRSLYALIEPLNICFHVEEEIIDDHMHTDWDNVVDRLLESENATVVVLVLAKHQTLKLFQACAKKNVLGYFTWICAESVCSPLSIFDSVKEVASGMLRIHFMAKEVTRFDEYFKQLTINTASSNPWFSKFYGSAFNCDPDKTDVNGCNRDSPILNSPDYRAEMFASLSIDAVYAIAHGLSAVLKTCKVGEKPRDCLKPSSIRSILLNLSFSGENGEIRFDNEGNVYSGFEIFNVFLKSGKLEIQQVGEWRMGNVTLHQLHTDRIQWVNASESFEHKPKFANGRPMSTCSEPCKVASEASVIGQSCCWKCKACDAPQITQIVKNLPRCENCPTLYWPDQRTHTQCLPIPVTYPSLNPERRAVVVVVILFMLLVLCTTSVLYVIHREDNLIRVCNFEMSFVILAGQVISCALALTFIALPSSFVCFMTSIAFHLSFTVTYGPVLVKSHRIYRLFLSETDTGSRFYSGTKAQLFLVAVILAIQLLFIVIGTVVDSNSSNVVTYMPNSFEKYVENTCIETLVSFYLPLANNLVLLCACGVYAFVIRHVDVNFYEVRFTSIYVFTIMLLWVFFVPGYAITATVSMQRVWLIVVMFINMLMCQALVFCSRLYGVYFVSELKQNIHEAGSILSQSPKE